MERKHWSRAPITVALAIAVLCTYSAVGAAAQTLPGATGVSGDLSAVGSVTVNGANAISGATILSGSTIVTGERSSAVINLGKTGRVELQPNSSVALSFTATGVNVTLNAGRVRLTTPAGVAGTVTAPAGTVVSDPSQTTAFTASIECGDIKVVTESGKVDLRGDNTTKTIAAGSSGSAGQVAPGTRCTPIPNTSGHFGTLSGGALAALLLAAGGAAALGIVAATRKGDNDLNFGGTPIILSTSR